MYCRLCLFFKQKTAYEMRISDWSSDVCSSDLAAPFPGGAPDQETHDLMHDLSRMQIWATALACGQTPGAREAMDLCQRTRAYIVGRTFPNANRKAKP